MIEILQDPVLKKLPSVQHAFFTRHGGVSQGCHAALNCSEKTKDHPDNVRENKRRAAAYLGYPLESLVTVKNVHGNQVAIVEKPSLTYLNLEADALVTNKADIILGSTSADCATVLFADDQAGVIGIAHAGWRGAKSGVIKSTVEKMISLGACSGNIVAGINACIAQDSYEVSAEFFQEFLMDDLENKQYFKPSRREDHFMFDLSGYVKDCLNRLNLKTVSSLEIDTYTDEERFFSCRRSVYRGEPDFGCHLSCIFMQGR